MIYECRVYSPSGELKQVHKSKFLTALHWKHFDSNPLNRTTVVHGDGPRLKDKPKPHKAQIRQPKPCKWCKNVFTPTHPKVKTCCPKCRRAYLNAYFKNRRELIKKGLVVCEKRGPSRRKNVPRI